MKGLTRGNGKFDIQTVRLYNQVGRDNDGNSHHFIFAGAALGVLCALGVFHVVGDLHANWGIVCLVACGMGVLALLFGKRFWEMVLTIWP